MKLSDQQIQKALKPFGVDADLHLAAQVRAYVDVLLFWNQKISLTSILDPLEILQRHFGESMFAAPRIKPASLLVDIGSGAGFPGLPLKLARPSLQVVLVEANTKKAVFLSEVVRKLSLDGVEVLHQRMESLRSEPHWADYIASRAVGNHSELLAWGRTALRGSGSVMLWLGKEDCALVKRTPGWEWAEEELIPGSDGRFLLKGNVSRET